MIIWINGSFGVGKTTIANALKLEIKDSLIYDPENVGEFLFNIMPEKKDDFQDYELWRTLNFEILKDLNRSHRVTIVPMTITNKKYYNEIIGNLRNEGIIVYDFILTATKEEIAKRLDKRGNSTGWAYAQVDKFISAFKNFNGYQIDTTNISVDKVADNILNTIIKKGELKNEQRRNV